MYTCAYAYVCVDIDGFVYVDVDVHICVYTHICTYVHVGLVIALLKQREQAQSCRCRSFSQALSSELDVPELQKPTLESELPVPQSTTIKYIIS